MKREYLRNANKLKNFKIYFNTVRKLDGNVFSEAKNLEHISFKYNQIESIHREAFSGLPYIKDIYLYENKIKMLHPRTFSSIANLNVLDMIGIKNCVNSRYTSANQKFPEIEAKISSHCVFELLPDEQNKIKIQEANDKIGRLTAEAQANQEKFKEITNKLEELKTEISSQQEKCVKELADQQKELTKIASEKLQLQAKITQLEAKNNQTEAKNSQVDIKIIQMEAKLTAQKLELLQECKSEALQEIVKHNIEQNLALEERINDQKDWNTKYSDEIETTCENNLRLVKIRLAVLENKDD